MAYQPNDRSSGNRLFAPVDIRQLFERLCDDLGYPLPPTLRSGGVSGNREFAESVGSHLPLWDLPADIDASVFRDLYLLHNVARKCPDLDTGIDTRKAAQRSFLDDELLNVETNTRLASMDPAEAGTRQVLYLASRKIHECLGEFDFDEFFECGRFGPGSTLQLKRHQASDANKLLCGSPRVTPSAVFLAQEYVSRCPQWAYGDPCEYEPWHENQGPLMTTRITEGWVAAQYDRWDSVPKNAKTDRSIGIPPDFNIFLQLSVGTMMRRRLRRSAGIDLQDQTVNQVLACRGSWSAGQGDSASLATVDLTSASQSLTTGLISCLFNTYPVDPRWFQVMDALRTPYTLIDQQLHENALFSAMGNGYTFELESLVFWAITVAVCETLGIPFRDVSVYGDDIIVDSRAVPLLAEVFTYAGLRLNADKSFYGTSGLTTRDVFRESCGKHYLRGIDVSPFYVDTSLRNVENIILCANNLLRWACRPGYRDGRVYNTWCWLLGHLPASMLRGIPFGEENDGIILDWDEAVPSARYIPDEPLEEGRKTFIGWSVRSFQVKGREKPLPDGLRYVTTLYKTSVKKVSGVKDADFLPWLREREPMGLDKPSQKTSVQVRNRVTLNWPRLGPWAGTCALTDGGRQAFMQIIATMRDQTECPGWLPRRVKPLVLTTR